MKPLHHTDRERHVLVGFVDERQRVTVARDLLLRAIRWLGAVRDEVPDALQRRDDALDAVGRLGALDDGVLA